MKAGIITFHCSYNYGSVLQAYALQRAIEKIGIEAKIIDYRSRDFNAYRLPRLRRPSRMIHDLLWYGKLLKRRDSFEHFIHTQLKLTEERYSYHNESALESLQEQYDCFICGSDQIWNLDCTGGAVGPFFLSFAGDKRRVAYAPSLAHTSFKQENFDRDRVSELLNRFDFISIREKETLPLFQPLVNTNIEVVLDPTLLLDSDSYQRMAANSRPVNSPYIFMYLLRTCSELVASINELSRRTGRMILYISERNFPIPNSINLFGAGPEEFISLIAHADAVLTNSFHATVFSVILHRPFRSFVIDRSASRMRGLMSELGLESHCAASIDGSCVHEENWEEVDRRLNRLRANSWDYLRRALS